MNGATKFRKGIACLLALSLVVALGVACAKRPAAEKQKELPLIRAAHMPYNHGVPANMLVENGWDVQSGFRTKLLVFTSGPPMIEAMAAGEWDVGGLGGIVGMTAAARYGAKIIGVMADNADGQDIWVRPDSPIAKVKGYNPQYPDVYGSPETVRGKTILLPVGTMGHYAVLGWLKVLGVKENEVKLVHMEVPQIVSAFEAGQGDIAFIWTPQTYVAAKKGWIKVASAHSVGLVSAECLITTKKAFEEQPELIARYVAQYYRAVAEMKRDPARAQSLMKAWFEKYGTKVDDESVKWEWEHRPMFTLEENLKLFEKGADGSSQVQKWYSAMADFFVAQGKLSAQDKEVALNSLTDKILRMAADYLKGGK